MLYNALDFDRTGLSSWLVSHIISMEDHNRWGQIYQVMPNRTLSNSILCILLDGFVVEAIFFSIASAAVILGIYDIAMMDSHFLWSSVAVSLSTQTGRWIHGPTWGCYFLPAWGL